MNRGVIKRAAIHDLKCHVRHFRDIRSRIKTFDIREDDRGYGVGDILLLREYDPRLERYTRETETRIIGYVLRDVPQFGLMPGYAILGFR